jgi:hypothetical protein
MRLEMKYKKTLRVYRCTKCNNEMVLVKEVILEPLTTISKNMTEEVKQPLTQHDLFSYVDDNGKWMTECRTDGWKCGPKDWHYQLRAETILHLGIGEA